MTNQTLPPIPAGAVRPLTQTDKAEAAVAYRLMTYKPKFNEPLPKRK